MSGLNFDGMVIDNFKSFIGEHTFALSRDAGLYYIAGRNKLSPELGANGVGKTTLWDALTWCLWGRTGRDSRPSASIIPWDLEKGTCSVSVTFTSRRKRSIITRARRPNALTLTDASGKSREISQDDVPKIIGMSEEMFRRTIVLSQFGSLFLDLRPEQQSALFSEALNLDLWLTASERASSKQKEFNGAVRESENALHTIAGAMATLDANLTRAQSEQSEYRSSIKTRQKELSRQIEAKRAEMAPYAAKLAALESQNKGTRAAKGAAPAPESPGEALSRWSEAASGIKYALAAEEAEFRAMHREAEALGIKVGEYRRALKGRGKCPECGQPSPKKHLEDKLSEVEAKSEDLQMALDNQKLIINEADNKRREANKALAICNTLTDLEASVQRLLGIKRALTDDNPHDKLVSTLEKQLQDAEKKRAEVQGVLDEATALAKGCGLWVGAFKEIRLNQIDAVLEELEIATTKHAGKLGLIGWRIAFQTERETKSGTVSTAFTVMLYPPDQEEPIRWESYSGGEAQRWQLAVAFGLSEILLARAGVDPNIEIYDEPSKALSKEGLDDLLEQLRTRARELDRAIYFVDHHMLDKGAFDGVITIIKDEKGAHIK